MWKILKKDSVLLFSAVAVFLLIACKFYYLDKVYIIEDEAYYWYWAGFPQWGYPEHPPLIAWLIYPFKQLWGAHPYSIRLIVMVMFLSLSPLVYFWTFQLCQSLDPDTRKKYSLITALVVQVIPFYNGASFINLPDSPLIFFLFLTSFLYYLAFFHQKKYFILAGVGLGLVGLSKLTALHLGLAIVFFAILSPDRKKYFLSPWFWSSFFFAGLVFSPYIIWNYQHDFPVLNNVNRHLARTTSLRKFYSFWIEQSILYLPIALFLLTGLVVPTMRKYLFAKLKKTIVDFRHRQSQQGCYLAILSFVPLLYFLYQSFTLPIRINWLSGAFVGLTVLVGLSVAYFWEKIKYWFLAYITILLLVFGFLFSFLANAGDETSWVSQTLKRIYPHYNYYLKSYYEYDFFANRFDAIYQEYITPLNQNFSPPLPIVAKGYQTPSLINYYQQPHPAAFGWANQENYVKIVFFYLDEQSEEFKTILQNSYFLLSRVSEPDLNDFGFNFDRQEIILITQFETYPQKPQISKDYYLFLVKSK